VFASLTNLYMFCVDKGEKDISFICVSP